MGERMKDDQSTMYKRYHSAGGNEVIQIKPNNAIQATRWMDQTAPWFTQAFETERGMSAGKPVV